MKYLNHSFIFSLVYLCCLTGFTQQEVPILDWYYTTKGNYDYEGSVIEMRPLEKSVTMDNEDNLIVSGSFEGQVDFSILEDDNQHILEHFDEGTSTFIAKYHPDKSNQFLYELEFRPWVVKTDEDNNIYIAGAFTQSANFDLKGDEHILTPVADWDIFLAKYSPDFDLQWAFSLPSSTSIPRPRDISIHETSNSVSFVGHFRNQIEVSPNEEESYVLDGQPSLSYSFLATYSLDGELKWAKQFAETRNETQNITHDAEGNIYWSAQFFDTIYPNPLDSTNYHVSESDQLTGSYDGIISKYSNDGEYNWSIFIKGDRSVSLEDVFVSKRKVRVVGTLVLDQFFYTTDSEEYSHSSTGLNYSTPYILSIDSETGEIIKLTTFEMHNAEGWGSILLQVIC